MDKNSTLHKVHWRDLTHLNTWEVFIENTLSIPWLVSSLILAYQELYLLAIPCSAFFFLTTLRQVHSGFHNTLGLSKSATRVNLFINSILMLSSMHAIKFNHLRHHRYNLKEDDYEGRAAKLNWYQAILYGPIHVFLIHKSPFSLDAKRYTLWVILELIAVFIFISFVFKFKVYFLIYHLAIMTLGELLAAFFAVWSVHHGCNEAQVARTQRTPWKNKLTYNMYFHLEHHLFPAVPTIKLPQLAHRIDNTLPGYEKKIAF